MSLRARCAALIAGLALAGCHGAPDIAPAGEYEAAWHAARDRFREANRLLHAELLASPAATVEALVDAENRLDNEAQGRLRAVTDEGAAYAEEAIGRAPDRVEGHLYLALHLALSSLARSGTSALLGGLPRRIRAAYERALALDPDFAAGGAHRLKGKFLARAPWPFGDRDAAREALRDADDRAPVRQNALFAGDLAFLEGDRDAALARWREATVRPPHPATQAIDDAVAELARRRLAAAAEAGWPAAR